MRHNEEIKRRIEWYENHLHCDEYDSYGESLNYIRNKACQKMLEFTLENGIKEKGLKDSQQYYKKILNSIKGYAKKHGGDYKDEGYACEIEGTYCAINWLLGDSEIKKILTEENLKYKRQIRALNKEINDINCKIAENDCILSTLDIN